MAEMKVNYTVKVIGEENIRQAVIDVFDAIFENSEVGEFAEVSIEDEYVLEVEDECGGSVENVVEILNTALFFLKRYGIMKYAIEIEGIEDRDYGAYDAFRIVYNDKESYIQQVEFDVDYGDLDEEDAFAEYVMQEEEALEQLTTSTKQSLIEYINLFDVKEVDEEEAEEYGDEITDIFEKYDIPYGDLGDNDKE